METCGLFFLHAHQLRPSERLWIASPYFVPDAALMYALQLAALRGVDVRIMLPERPDHKLVYLAGVLVHRRSRAGRREVLPLPARLHAPQSDSGGR